MIMSYRKLLALLLVFILVFSACSAPQDEEQEDAAVIEEESSADTVEDSTEEETSAEMPEEEPAQPQYLVPAWDESLPSLWETFDGLFQVGAAVNTDQLKPDTDFYRTITKHYNVFVTENEMKPMYVNPSEGTFHFTAPDRFVEFGEEVGATLRGHTLVWHSQAPDWWFRGSDNGRATREELLSRMETYITEVMTRYKGRVAVWDVVNEAFSDQGKGLRMEDEGSQYAAIIGDLDGDGNLTDYIEQAFYMADAADPDAQLIINDYSLENGDAKLNSFYESVKAMLEKGVPIDGAGIQAHIQIGWPSVPTFEKAIEKLATLKEINPDFKVQITELDVSIFAWDDQSKEKEMTPQLQAELATRYADLFDMFRRQAEKGNLDMVVTWGVYDGRSWLDSYPVAGRVNAPLLFDRQMNAKPAFWGVVDRTKIKDACAEIQ